MNAHSKHLRFLQGCSIHFRENVTTSFEFPDLGRGLAGSWGCLKVQCRPSKQVSCAGGRPFESQATGTEQRRLIDLSRCGACSRV
eukprot:3687769-Rhodomonas_salina.1